MARGPLVGHVSLPLPVQDRPLLLGGHRPTRNAGHFLSPAESPLALAALASLCAGERDAIEVLRRLLRRVRPMVVPRVS